MQVTDIKVWPYSKEGSSFLGNGSLTFDNTFFVKFTLNASPRDGSPYISFPSRKGKAKDGSDKWFPEMGFIINEEVEDPSERYAAKNEVEKQVIVAYNKALGISGKKESGDDSRFDYGDNAPTESGDKNEEPKEPVKKKIPLIKLRK